MFTKIGTEGVLGLFDDNIGTEIQCGENCVKSQHIKNSKHDLLPTIQGFELETKLQGQNNVFSDLLFIKLKFPKPNI